MEGNAMLTAEARIDTERACRYLTQLCKHAAAMGGAQSHRPRVHLRGAIGRREVHVQADWTDNRGTLTFTPWGQCTLAADATVLTVRIEASDEDNLQRIRDVITRDLERFGRRDQLAVNWHQGDAQRTPRRDRPVNDSPQ
jgi:hypothetical protein